MIDENIIKPICTQSSLFCTAHRVLEVIKNYFRFNKVLSSRIPNIILTEANLFISVWRCRGNFKDLVSLNSLSIIGQEEPKANKISCQYVKKPFYRGQLLKLLDGASLPHTSKFYYKPSIPK